MTPAPFSFFQALLFVGVPRHLASHPAFRPAPARHRGFTLIELLVAITVMALLAVLSWRGLDAMARAQSQTSLRADDVLTLQAGLGQWKVDLDALTQTLHVNSLDWDGRVLRLTRRTVSGGDGLLVNLAQGHGADEGGIGDLAF